MSDVIQLAWKVLQFDGLKPSQLQCVVSGDRTVLSNRLEVASVPNAATAVFVVELRPQVVIRPAEPTPRPARVDPAPIRKQSPIRAPIRVTTPTKQQIPDSARNVPLARPNSARALVNKPSPSRTDPKTAPSSRLLALSAPNHSALVPAHAVCARYTPSWGAPNTCEVCKNHRSLHGHSSTMTAKGRSTSTERPAPPPTQRQRTPSETRAASGLSQKSEDTAETAKPPEASVPYTDQFADRV